MITSLALAYRLASGARPEKPPAVQALHNGSVQIIEHGANTTNHGRQLSTLHPSTSHEQSVRRKVLAGPRWPSGDGDPCGSHLPLFIAAAAILPACWRSGERVGGS